MTKAGQSAQRRSIGSVLVAVSLLFGSIAETASAGPPALDQAGKFIMIQGAVSPPRAGDRATPRGVAVDFASFRGNIQTGEPPVGQSAVRETEYRTPRGLRFNHQAFPRCPVSTLDRSGPPACPPASRIGSGAVIVDARPALPDFLRLTNGLIFNGTDGFGRPSILLWFKISGITVTVPAEIRAARGDFGPSFVNISAGAVPESGYVPVSLSLTFPRKSTRVRGKTVYLFEAPTTCRGSWAWQQVNTSFAGDRLVAGHQTPCTA